MDDTLGVTQVVVSTFYKHVKFYKQICDHNSQNKLPILLAYELDLKNCIRRLLKRKFESKLSLHKKCL